MAILERGTVSLEAFVEHVGRCPQCEKIKESDLATAPHREVPITGGWDPYNVDEVGSHIRISSRVSVVCQNCGEHVLSADEGVPLQKLHDFAYRHVCFLATPDKLAEMAVMDGRCITCAIDGNPIEAVRGSNYCFTHSAATTPST